MALNGFIGIFLKAQMQERVVIDVLFIGTRKVCYHSTDHAAVVWLTAHALNRQKRKKTTFKLLKSLLKYVVKPKRCI